MRCTIRASSIFLVAAWSLASVCGCASMQVISASQFAPAGVLAIAPPQATITNVSTGDGVRPQDLATLIQHVRRQTETLLQHKGYRLQPADACAAALDSHDFTEAGKQLLRGRRGEAALPAVPAWECLASHGTDFVVLVDVTAKAGAAEGGLGIIPLWVPSGGVSISFSGPHALDPSAAILSATIVDLRQHRVVWQHQIFNRQNVNNTTVLNRLLTELFEPIQGGT